MLPLAWPRRLDEANDGRYVICACGVISGGDAQNRPQPCDYASRGFISGFIAATLVSYNIAMAIH